ncbi:peptidoglycan -binding protein [Devosia sp. J2-20]|jgi:chemotaxis protein MotB|uniref:Peptidoglycan -binding protein n=1 Tax=Devosia litorisediminis TaxID=2829817 RepID=A0A942E9C6_9HYPH|nr:MULTISPECIES: peptidoglycan -binding protein [Devosia]MBS3847219.1 peptidoglycan -binding protein [Devosia litorisediminis]MCZ4346591.1 peptidoglycan -binding protein [Devosia neptuniae]WDQ99641.1 peptidoglycan -binding protein [Devosia sp. J2-20]|tara:strand:+ start:350 stop:1375 length:1026 start_codon:yes stop_codon:yes gene_type:complete
MPGARSRRRIEANYWPGFVDALSSLLLVIIFMLSLFMLTQFFLGQEIQGRDTALARLNSQIAELTDLLQLERANSDDLTSQIANLTATLGSAQAENTSLSNQLAGIGAGIDGKDDTIAGLQGDLLAAQELSNEANAQVALLNQQLAALRTQIGALEMALEASEARDVQSRTQIADLGRRLNVALAQRVQDLTRYRSDFFGRLRQILEGRADVRVVGDRFVFQSEVLFEAGQADVQSEGLPDLDALADAILQLETEIPADINWVLRIDGHTDSRPISNARFPSNWELSAARAISVAQYLVSKGVSPNRLVAAGFGEFTPLDPGENDDAYRRNRRIEFKLTEG